MSRTPVVQTSFDQAPAHSVATDTLWVAGEVPRSFCSGLEPVIKVSADNVTVLANGGDTRPPRPWTVIDSASHSQALLEAIDS